jgi:hypothetical protein
MYLFLEGGSVPLFVEQYIGLLFAFVMFMLSVANADAFTNSSSDDESRGYLHMSTREPVASKGHTF